MPDLASAPPSDINRLVAKAKKQEEDAAATRVELAAIYDAAAERDDATMSDDESSSVTSLEAKLAAQTGTLALTRQDIAETGQALQTELTASGISVRECVEDDPKRGFANLGDFALEILNAGPGNNAIMANPRLMAAAGTGMVQGIREDGGVLVPPAFSTDVWDGARQQSESMLQYCDVQTIDGSVQSVTTPGINETSRADGSRWGGIRGYWKGELTQMTSSQPKYRDVKIEPQELYVFAYISDKLLRHAPGLASSILMTAASDEINFKLGDAIVNGDGAGKPLGWLGHASVVSIAKETGQAAATISKENIDKMWARCHANWRAGAVWFINQDVEPQLEQLVATAGTGGVPAYLPAGGIADTPNARLKGRPVIPIEYAATLGTVGDISLANLSSYRVGIRGTVDQQQSMHLKFDFAQTAFRFIFEADGQPMLASPITPYKGTATLSPIVTLATR